MMCHRFNEWRASAACLMIAATLASLPSAKAQTPTGRGSPGAPPVDRELRGLWVATVDNIDWPSKPNLPVRDQKAELLAIFDKAVKLNLNAIFLQVRPACDAIYDSKLEPWSGYLTGRMGVAPKPYYDPLAFAVDEAHKRGLELHAWFNPFRALVRDPKFPPSRNHISATHPELVRSYGKYLWLDPTEPGARDYSYKVIMDVVRRYDIDGVHFDDYFYPYPEKATPASTTEMEFPDAAAWKRYQRAGGHLSRNDWRRENVDLFVDTIYSGIKQMKPWVKFGVAPFGIWQPHHPQQIIGFDAYNNLYCDPVKWLTNGWVDYLAPQLYWPVAQTAQSFPVLLKWWAAENTRHRLLFSGMKVDTWKGVRDDARELTNEIVSTRKQYGASGEILWHSKPLMANHGGIADALRAHVYYRPALVPACPWLGNECPGRAELSVKKTSRLLKLGWKQGSGKVWQWVVQKKAAGHWTTEILPGEATKEAIPIAQGGTLPEIITVAAVNRYGNMSEAAVFYTAHLTK